MEYFEFGTPIDACSLMTAQETSRAVALSNNFKIVELRSHENQKGYSEIIVVDTEYDGIPSSNVPGIRYRERLGLRFFSSGNRTPEVHPLRKDFPNTGHLNHTLQDEPTSLCLYFESWETIRRSWTPQKHLHRILWWLEQTALGKLHKPDQPLEQFFFKSGYELVLPPDFHEYVESSEHNIRLSVCPPRKNGSMTFIGEIAKKGDVNWQIHASCISFTFPPVIHGSVEKFYYTLGDLTDSLNMRGVLLLEALSKKIIERFEGGVKDHPNDERTVLLFSIPLIRQAGGEIEKYSSIAYFIGSGLSQLGINLGVLERHEGMVIIRRDIGGSHDGLVKSGNSEAWRTLPVFPMEILFSLNRELARAYSGIESVGPQAVLAGVGALGSALLGFWTRSGWGEWALIDPDYIKPHNLTRLSILPPAIGLNKANAAAISHNFFYQKDKPIVAYCEDIAENFDSDELLNIYKNKDLIIDATTTLTFPRDFSKQDSLPRGISVFLTPNAQNSVLLAEDKERLFRLNHLEPQYYRFILNSKWGDKHLEMNQSQYWSGAGCRDISAAISPEIVAIHSGILSRQIRNTYETQNASIKVWHFDSATGAVQGSHSNVERTIKVQMGEYTIFWDEGLRRKIRKLRNESLPNETGGVLLGYFDLSYPAVYIVDTLLAPPDSHKDPTGFARGKDGLLAQVESALEKTAQIVGYIGEWHSHPPKHSACASAEDLYLMAHLAKEMHSDGLPALMLIVAEKNETWNLARVIE